MKAGLFVCDHVSNEFQSEFGDYPEMFANFLPDLDWTLYDVCNGEFPETLEECDLYMATGSRYSVYEDLDWIRKLKKVIQNIYRENKCFVGFCFGHQLIGEALGGKVEKSHHGWCVGVHEFEMAAQQPWMDPWQEQYNLAMMCQDQIVELPEGCIKLAGNNICPNGLIQLGNKILGIQAHPEFTIEYDRVLIEARKDRIGVEIAKKGLGSLMMPLDQNLMREWIQGFIEKALGTYSLEEI